MVLRPFLVRVRETAVFARWRRIGMCVAVSDLLFVAGDFSVMGKNAGLMRKNCGLGTFKDGERFHMFCPPAVVVLSMSEMRGVSDLVFLIHFAFALLQSADTPARPMRAGASSACVSSE